MKNIIISVYVLFIMFIVGSAVYAAKTFDGDIDNAYAKGMKYQEELIVIRQQGLKFSVGKESITAGKPSIIELAIIDNSEKLLTGATVYMEISRHIGRLSLPTVRAFELREGHYQAEITLPSYGLWQINARIQNNDLYEVNHGFRIYAQGSN